MCTCFEINLFKNKKNIESRLSVFLLVHLYFLFFCSSVFHDILSICVSCSFVHLCFMVSICISCYFVHLYLLFFCPSVFLVLLSNYFSSCSFAPFFFLLFLFSPFLYRGLSVLLKFLQYFKSYLLALFVAFSVCVSDSLSLLLLFLFSINLHTQILI